MNERVAYPQNSPTLKTFLFGITGAKQRLARVLAPQFRDAASNQSVVALPANGAAFSQRYSLVEGDIVR
jgi:hypothetical protein